MPALYIMADFLTARLSPEEVITWTGWYATALCANYLFTLHRLTARTITMITAMTRRIDMTVTGVFSSSHLPSNLSGCRYQAILQGVDGIGYDAVGTRRGGLSQTILKYNDH